MELTLTKRQKRFCDADAFEVLYGGAAGGGKSYGQLADALLYALRYRGSRQIIFRRTYPELEKSLIRTAYELYPQDVCKLSKTAHSASFTNGSVIDFGYCDSEEDVYKYQSAEYDVIRFDELTHFTETMYKYLISRCRGVNGYPKHIKSSTNPGGIGHSWVKARFIDPSPPDSAFKAGSVTRIFIPAKVSDNKFLMTQDPDYVRRLEALDERDRRALLEGDWDLQDGRFFESFDRSVHVLKPFKVADYWLRYITIDYGLDMLAAYKIAVDERGFAYVTDEVYEGKDCKMEGLIVSEAAKRLKSLIGSDSIRAIFAPPDLWSRQKDTGKSIAQLFSDCGVSLTKVSSAREHGWLQLKEWLKVYDGEDGQKTANLRIFDRCTNLIRTLSSIQCDSSKCGDCAVTPHELTQAPDALRYFVSGRPRNAPFVKNVYRYGFEFEKPRPEPTGLGESIQII